VEVLVVLERGEGLGDHGVRLARKAQDGGEIVGQAGATRLRVAEGQQRPRGPTPSKYHMTKSKKCTDSSRIHEPTRAGS
jgi:hypothetical protein